MTECLSIGSVFNFILKESMVNERPAKIHVILITANGDQTEVFTVKSENVKDVDDLCDQV